MTVIPATLLPALHGLNKMLCQFWPEQAAANQIPLAFWQIEDESLLFDALQYLPANVLTRGGSTGQGHSADEIERLPEGFRLLVTIFELEDAFAGEGWSGLSNVGESGLAEVIAAYEQLGLDRRATALQRVLAAFRKDPDDEKALKKAARGELPDLVDDDDAFNIIVRYIKADPDTRFGILPHS